MVRMVKWDLRQPASNEDLRWMEHVLSLHPNIGLFQIYAMALAQQGQPQQAIATLQRGLAALGPGPGRSTALPEPPQP